MVAISSITAGGIIVGFVVAYFAYRMCRSKRNTDEPFFGESESFLVYLVRLFALFFVLFLPDNLFNVRAAEIHANARDSDDFWPSPRVSCAWILLPRLSSLILRENM